MIPESIRLNAGVCQNVDSAIRREWLETNGLGGFASSTVSGVNTRRYHGLLTAALRPPAARAVLVAKFEETLICAGERTELSANRYPGMLHPQGWRHITEFRLDPFPVWSFEAAGNLLEKTIFMVHGENTTVVEYTLRGQAECTLELMPLVAFRDYHALTHRNDSLRTDFLEVPGRVSVQPYPELPVLHFAHNGSSIERTGNWYFNLEYDAERERGLDFREDLFNPFLLRFELKPGDRATVIISLDPREATQAAGLRQAEIDRRHLIAAASPADNPFVRRMTVSADQYIVRRGDLKTVIAGYHWFSDWGRDTMIALPGLTLTTGRFEDAKHILLAFAAAVDQGMLPNRFPDQGEEPEYNTADATLWFLEAIRAYIEHTEDCRFVAGDLYPALRSIMDWHLRGTRFGIRVDRDGLLRAGDAGSQLTWMDVKIGDRAVTSRHGKPVEIQALWYNALRIFAQIAGHAGDDDARLFAEEMAALASDSFNAQFWNEARGCLFDCISTAGVDASMRPNQILAVSLHHSMLPIDRARKVVEAVERDLLTPMGLRSLSTDSPDYHGHYEGTVRDRDGAYHQGTVWPWLMGPFLTAYRRVCETGESADQRIRDWLKPFEDQLTFGGLGHIPEITDGSDPFTPRGCIAQAWSVAEILRVAVAVNRGKTPTPSAHFRR